MRLGAPCRSGTQNNKAVESILARFPEGVNRPIGQGFGFDEMGDSSYLALPLLRVLVMRL